MPFCSHRNRCGECKCEAGAMARLAGYFHGTTVMANDLLDDRQPDPCSSFPRLQSLARPVELPEDLLELFVVHADALVLNRNADPTVRAASKGRHLSARWRVFDRIGQQVVKRILHQLTVAAEDRKST